MELKIKRIADVELPKTNHEGDAGIDLRSAEEFVLKPGEQKAIKTGLQMRIPEGYVGLIWDRSGIAAKNSIHTLAGVIDSSYRGEVLIVLRNLGTEEFRVEKNMRIAQMIIQPYLEVDILEGDLQETTRGESGFGSTKLH